MPNVGAQIVGPLGARFYFQRDTDTTNAMLDLGTIKAISAKMEPKNIKLEDPDGGVLHVIDQQTVAIDESYEVTLVNHHPDILSILYLADPPSAFTQGTTEIEDVQHKIAVGAGRNVQLRDADGNPLNMLNSAVIYTASSSGGTQLVVGTSWDWVSKDRGMIQFHSGQTGVVEGNTVFVSITPLAITGKRLVKPQTLGIIKGEANVIWSRNRNAEQIRRVFTASLAPSAQDPKFDDYSELKLTVQVLSDPLDTDYPAGKLILFKGDLPATP